MVRNSIIISLLIVFGCCFPRLSREQYKRKLKPFTLEKNTNQDVFKLIDTLSIYEPVNKNEELNYFSVLKFYKHGEIGGFILFEGDSINREKFNPINSDLGIYNYKNDALFIERSFYRQGNSSIYIDSYFVKNDTIFNDKNEPIFVKNTSIPKEWLQGWKPDW